MYNDSVNMYDNNDNIQTNCYIFSILDNIISLKHFAQLIGIWNYKNNIYFLTWPTEQIIKDVQIQTKVVQSKGWLSALYCS